MSDDRRQDMYRMPTVFGPAMGPRRGPDGRIFDCINSPISTQISVAFVSSAAQLQRLLPDCFELSGEPIVTVTATCMKEIDWLAGRGYNMLGVSFPLTGILSVVSTDQAPPSRMDTPGSPCCI
jgi:hypothetical protein